MDFCNSVPSSGAYSQLFSEAIIPDISPVHVFRLLAPSHILFDPASVSAPLAALIFSYFSFQSLLSCRTHPLNLTVFLICHRSSSLNIYRSRHFLKKKRQVRWGVAIRLIWTTADLNRTNRHWYRGDDESKGTQTVLLALCEMYREGGEKKCVCVCVGGWEMSRCVESIQS